MIEVRLCGYELLLCGPLFIGLLSGAVLSLKVVAGGAGGVEEDYRAGAVQDTCHCEEEVRGLVGYLQGDPQGDSWAAGVRGVQNYEYVG